VFLHHFCGLVADLGAKRLPRAQGLEATEAVQLYENTVSGIFGLLI
jgi:hypothetical protein